MELSNGYIQCEVGLIPGDWKCVDLSDLCTLQRGFDITETTRVPGTVPVYSSSGLSYHHNKALVAPPGVVTGRKGILGKVFLIDEPFWPHDTTLWVKDFKGNQPAYVALVLQNFHLERLDAATSVPTLNRNNLFGHKVAVPATKAEQEAIAKVLSDADSLIESLERLVAKKRNLKQSTMEELLTGKRRLPEFATSDRYKQTEVGVIPEDWHIGTIGQAIGRLDAGASVNSERDGEAEFDSYPCVLKTGAASNGSFDPRESKRVARRDLWRLKVSLRKDTILVSRMNTIELVGESGYVALDYPNLFVPDRMWMMSIRSPASVHGLWLSYVLTWRPVKSQISDSATGTSGSMKNISKPSFRAIQITYPTVDEQKAIAGVLCDIDADISVLEERLSKARKLKQGMMQELLTGRIRLT